MRTGVSPLFGLLVQSPGLHSPGLATTSTTSSSCGSRTTWPLSLVVFVLSEAASSSMWKPEILCLQFCLSAHKPKQQIMNWKGPPHHHHHRSSENTSSSVSRTCQFPLSATVGWRLVFLIWLWMPLIHRAAVFLFHYYLNFPGCVL